MLQRYAKAWIRLHTANDVRSWTPDEILDTFCLLPSPTVAPADWLALRSALANPVQAAPTEDDIFAMNAANVEGAKADAKMFPGIIKVETNAG